MSRVLGLTCSRAEKGAVTVRMQESIWPLNPNGAVHGGLVIACADQCFGLVSMTAVERELAPATATLNSEFVRPALLPLTFHARVDRAGRTMAFISVDVFDRDGRLATKVSGTMIIDGSSRFIV